MAKTGKTNAGAVPSSVPHIKSRGLKNPSPADYDMAQSEPDMTKSKSAPPASGKKAPGEM